MKERDKMKQDKSEQGVNQYKLLRNKVSAMINTARKE